MAQVTCPVRMPRSDDPARVCGEPFPSALEALEHVKTAHDQARYEYDRISGETIARLIETNGLDFDVENGPAMAAAIRELIAAEVMRREGRRQSPIPTAVGDLYPGEMLTSIENEHDEGPTDYSQLVEVLTRLQQEQREVARHHG